MRTTTIATARKRVSHQGPFVPDFWFHIGMNIFHKRIAAKLTQEQLAERAGVSLRRLHSIETAATDNVSLKTLGALTKALGMEIRDVFKPRKDYVRV